MLQSFSTVSLILLMITVFQLPGVEACSRYRFRYGRNPMLMLPLSINPSGSARSELQTFPHNERSLLSSQIDWKIVNKFYEHILGCANKTYFHHTYTEWRFSLCGAEHLTASRTLRVDHLTASTLCTQSHLNIAGWPASGSLMSTWRTRVSRWVHEHQS